MYFHTRKQPRILRLDWIRHKASLARGRLRHSDHTRIKNEESNVDPDDGNSWFCSACTLPIFFTPFKEISHHDHTNKEDNGRGGGGSSSNGRRVFLHDQFANLPEQIGHVLHPQLPLNLKKNQLPTSSTTNDVTTSNCTNCSRKCGSLFYGCADSKCHFQLDVLCALPMQITISHRSHEHRLTVIRAGALANSLIICGACGAQHTGTSNDQDHSTDLFYFCNACSFWIHPDCASLPSVITPLHENRHQHSLFLTYHPVFGSDDHDDNDYKCAICGEVILSNLGVYLCAKCHYYAHIRCATSDPQSYEPVLIREAKLADLLHFPLADEQASVMHYIMENVDTRDHGHHRSHPPKLDRRGLHQHRLKLHDYVQPGQPSSPVCNACVQFISPPFFRCIDCPDFFLHSCCVNLPREINEHPFHRQHTLELLTPAHTPSSTLFDSFARFNCNGCWRQCNGFAYACALCNFAMDVVCALMPSSITHESHGKAHILYVSYNEDASQQSCKCCNTFLPGIWYECSTCHNFKIHANCALLPKTIVWHTFDDHPLKLTTKPRKSVSTHVGHDVIDSKEAQQLCEICEEDMLKGVWYYNCSQCDKSFHINCIPSVDGLSKINFGFTIEDWSHGCRLTLVRHSTVHGCRCGSCGEIFTDVNAHELFAYECSKCNYRIHENCNNEFMPDFRSHMFSHWYNRRMYKFV